MSAPCHLEVVLDRSDRAYRVGDIVSGVVHVRTERALDCSEIVIEPICTAARRSGGVEELAPPVQLHLPKPGWKAGETRSYPFAFDAPRNPLTYDGDRLRVRWHVHARAEMNGDAKVKESVGGRARFTLDEREVAGSQKAPLSATAGAVASVLHLAFDGLPRIVAAVGLAALGVLIISSTEIPGWRAVGAVAVGIAALIVFGPVLAIVSAWRVGSVETRTWPARVGAGETFVCAVRVSPQRSILIRRLTAFLVGTQYTRVRTSGGGSQLRATVFHRVPHELSDRPVRTRAARSVVFEGLVDMPGDARETVPDAIGWHIEIEIVVHRWPDWRRRGCTLRVVDRDA